MPSEKRPTRPSGLAVPRSHGLGLRAQIVLALCVAFVGSFSLLGVATTQLAERARTLDREAGARGMARALAAAVAAGGLSAADTLAASVIGEGGVAGVELEVPGLEPRGWGVVPTARSVAVPVEGGGRVRLYLRPADASDAAPLTNLLLLYVAVTGGAILLLAFVALTHLIVRPVSALTQASERIASGSLHVEVPVRGAAEVARLAVAFNAMATQLRGDRQELEERLEELERTATELRSAQEQVVRGERLASVGRLSAGVAHEIGNPLAAILGLVELLREGGLEEAERDEFLRRIHRETERINGIIRGLLDFSRQGRTDGAGAEQADLRSVVDEASHLVAPQKDLRRVDIERRFAADLPAVRGSATRLTQLVLNLLLNAADAIDGDGAIVVEVGLDPDGGDVVLTVSDSGPGIAPEVRAHLFEPFVTTKPPGEGTGLGLAVCHTIVDELGGSIEAGAAPGGGARFTVRLPVA